MIIGRYEKSGDDFVGSMKTLTFQVDGVHLVHEEKGADYVVRGPDDSELGAAFRKSGQFGDYLSIKLDSPTLLAPINAVMALKPNKEGVYFMRWQRRAERNGEVREQE